MKSLIFVDFAVLYNSITFAMSILRIRIILTLLDDGIKDQSAELNILVCLK